MAASCRKDIPHFLTAIFIISLSLPSGLTSTCGYEACPEGKPDFLNVHIICHTHDDVGWIHTVDNYYHMSVREILSSVINSLMQNENRKFIYVETAFFSMWWDQQTDLVKEYVERLVNDGRLEFISGGWSMNDEATTHYLGIIDQMTLGLRWLNNTFGSCGTSKVGWQIDSFGHSREQASLLAQMNFDGLFFGRVHYQDKAWREKTKTMEFLWKTSESLGENSYLFTGVLPNVYWPPKGFCYDVLCSDEELTEDNINYKGHTFVNLAEQQAKHYGSNHIAMTMGMDFYYRDAAKWYRNLDYLIRHVNSLQAIGMRVNVFYSTPTCYLHSLNKANVTWPTRGTFDFFPYSSKQNEYWTGYFTSRPALKYLIRKSNAYLQACKQLVTLADGEREDILTLYKAVGVAQHHDAITGTEKQHVSEDYTRRLSEGYALCENAVGKSFRLLLSNNTILPHMTFCSTFNTSQCMFTELENQFLAVMYNPLGHTVKHYVRLPVIHEGYLVKQVLKRRRPVPAQIVPIPPSVLSLPERSSLAKNELIFPVTLPPLGFSIYSIHMLEDLETANDINSGSVSTFIQDAVIKNEHFKVIIDGYSGLMKEIILLESNTSVPIKQSFYYYEGMPGYRIERASGAYAFNPQYDQAFALQENITYRVYKGPLVEEIHQYYAPWISQTIRVYKRKRYVEFDWVIGPIPVQDHIGREIITRFDTNLQNSGTFYTDSNSRETIKRVRNFQETWPWNVTEDIAGNYYPITSWIYMKDEARDLQLSILPDRAQGGSSARDGSLELMVHRRLLFDDGYGVNEALNEPGFDGRGLVVRGTHHLTIGSIRHMTPYNKQLAKINFYSPIIGFAKFNSSRISRYSFAEFRGLARQLPSNIHLLTLERLDESRVLLRLEHFYEAKDHPDLSKPATVSLTNIFKPFKVIYVEETNLSADRYLYGSERLQWNFNEDDQMQEQSVNEPNSMNEVENGPDTSRRRSVGNQTSQDNLRIRLKPMEIRTFIVKIENKSRS